MYIGWDQHLQPTNQQSSFMLNGIRKSMYTGLSNMTEYSFLGELSLKLDEN